MSTVSAYCPKCRCDRPVRPNRTQHRCGKCGTFLGRKEQPKGKAA